MSGSIAVPAAPDPVPAAPDPVLGYVDGPLAIWDKQVGEQSGEMAEVAGTLELVDGCLVLQGEFGGTFPVLWRHGTTWNAADETVRLTNGDQLAIGNAISRAGGFHRADTLSFFTSVPAVLDWAETCSNDWALEIAVT